jgi:hypothetical protein
LPVDGEEWKIRSLVASVFPSEETDFILYGFGRFSDAPKERGISVPSAERCAFE